ncbi:MAG: hypothetical protein JW866_11050 [Ignavibacteriales bacterium]|nr:hypothetical protein [Ignavibacteriales bacterium]
MINQSHSGNLLLCFLNGFYSEIVANKNSQNCEKLSPYCFGPNWEGYSEQTHYDFINLYRRYFCCNAPSKEYLKQVKYSPERIEIINKLSSDEGLTIQVEMLIYLKFWEMDMVIKKLYELTRIINGEDYDWHFKIAESNRDDKATGKRQDIIRILIRKRIKEKSPLLSKWIIQSYNTQIRNSIAHSNFSIHNRFIQLNNYIEKDPESQIFGITFDEWYKIFHKTLVLHNELIWLKNRVFEHYAQKYLQGEIIEIQITEIEEKKRYGQLEYRKEVKDWVWKNN